MSKQVLAVAAGELSSGAILTAFGLAAGALGTITAGAGIGTALASGLAGATLNAGVSILTHKHASFAKRVAQKLREPDAFFANGDVTRKVGECLGACLGALAIDENIPSQHRSLYRELSSQAPRRWPEIADAHSYRGLDESTVTRFFNRRWHDPSDLQTLTPDQFQHLLVAIADRHLTPEERATIEFASERLPGMLPQAVFEGFKLAQTDNDPAYAALQFMLVGEMAEALADVQRSLVVVDSLTREVQKSQVKEWNEIQSMRLMLTSLDSTLRELHRMEAERHERLAAAIEHSSDSLRSLSDGLVELADRVADLTGVTSRIDLGVHEITQLVAESAVATSRRADVFAAQLDTRIDGVELILFELIKEIRSAAHQPRDGVLDSSRVTSERARPLDPEPLESIVGREGDALTIKSLVLEKGTRLVVLVGPPCVGKSTLALHVSHRISREGKIPGHRVDLANVKTAEDAAARVAESLGVLIAGTRQSGAQKHVQQTLINVLKERGPVLLLLDHFERLVGHASSTVLAWLQGAPELMVVAASREAIDYADTLGPSAPRCEVYRVRPLRVPESNECDSAPAEVLERIDSVRLFIDRATVRRPGFSASGDDIRHIARICIALGGFPACIELAAACVDSASLRQIHQNLAAAALKPRRLTTGDAVSRSYLYPALDASLSHMSEVERRCFLQLADFPVGVNVEEADGLLLTTPDSPSIRVLQDLRYASLIEVSVVHNASLYTGELRAYLYEPIREYASQRLRSDLGDDLYAEHLKRVRSYLMSYATRCNRAMRGSDDVLAHEALLLERPNLAALLDKEIQRGDIRASAEVLLQLEESFLRCGPAATLQAYVTRVLSLPGSIDVAHRSRLIRRYSEALWLRGDYPQALEQSKRALELASQQSDGEEHAIAMGWHGRMLSHAAHHDEAIPLLRLAHERLRSSHQHSELAQVALTMSNCYDWKGDTDKSLTLLTQSEQTARSSGDQSALARVLNRRGIVLWHNGCSDQALQLFHEARDLNRALSDTVWVAGAITNCGLALSDLDRFEEAAAHFDEAQLLHLQQGNLGWDAVNAVGRARMLLYAGRDREAIAEVDRVEPAIKDITYHENLALLHTVRAVARYLSGDVERAAFELRDAVRKLHRGSRKMLRAYIAYVIRAECEHSLGNRDKAVKFLYRAARVAKVRTITSDYRVRYVRDITRRARILAEDLGVPVPVVDMCEPSVS
ncbi:MAG: tetratricopeptide repeat protein [Phycisphaeraceae bacterium]|nr:MAG: tetratricopeptide repeat protein [Phycisphaeraceae bacterium]